MNFALILFVLVILTGVAWVADKLVFLPKRRRAAEAAVAEFDRQQERIGERFADENAAQTRARLRDDKLRQPWWLEYTASFFPVILAVFVVRSFIIEPFKIPSGSMVPTLLVGDFILVNKYEYGLRMPITNTKLTNGGPRSIGLQHGAGRPRAHPKRPPEPAAEQRCDGRRQKGPNDKGVEQQTQADSGTDLAEDL